MELDTGTLITVGGGVLATAFATWTAFKAHVAKKFEEYEGKQANAAVNDAKIDGDLREQVAKMEGRHTALEQRVARNEGDHSEFKAEMKAQVVKILDAVAVIKDNNSQVKNRMIMAAEQLERQSLKSQRDTERKLNHVLKQILAHVGGDSLPVPEPEPEYVTGDLSAATAHLRQDLPD